MPRSSREKSQETRANIIEAAYTLFLERGYNATSMRDLSQRAGVTVGAIYNHFQTKEEIWKEVILAKHPYHEIFPLIQAAEGETVADVIRSAAQVLISELFKRTDLFNLMFIEIVEFHAKHANDLFQAIYPHLENLPAVFEGKKGKLRDIPYPVLLRSFIGLFMSFYITGIFARAAIGDSADEVTLDQFVDLYLHGVLVDEDPPSEEEA